MLSDLFPALFDSHLIKIVFLVHATITPMPILFGIPNYARSAYLLYNLVFHSTLLLSILVESNPNIVLVSAAYNALCMVLDILTLIVGGSNMNIVAMLLMIFNLLCRPVSTILLIKNYSARAGVSDPTAGLLEVEVPRARSAYQNIDEPNQNLP